MARYRLLVGRHSQKDSEGNSHTYIAKQADNDIVESDIDLVARCGVDKFAKIEGYVNGPADDGLDSLTVQQLRSYAQDEEIDLGHATRKEDILKLIRDGLDKG